ncbi:UNVERIFIED_CONTAM: hypothetical protein FKN15_072899 [Acipenser sinensis]
MPGVASELGVRGYPTIKLLKGDLAYNYRGPRTKDDIIEFANRVAGPVVRSLPSQQMFEHVQKRHDVLFLYVGGESPLKEKYIEVASELIVYTYFFSALEEVLPKHVALQELPAVLVFKDGTYFVYDEYEDGDLSSWINKERFQGYLHIDGFTLYELEDTADSDDGSEEAELFKREGRDQELTDEGSEEELQDGNDEQQPESGAEHSDEEREEKTSTEKKTD